MNHISYLKRIRFLHHFLLLCAVMLAAFGSLMGGVAALALAFIIVWIYHRCPKCNGEVDTLLALDKESCCPLCGCLLKDGTGGAEPQKAPAEEPAAEQKEGAVIDKAV